MARRRSKTIQRTEAQKQRLIESAKRSSVIDRLNYKFRQLAKAKGVKINELNPVKIIGELYKGSLGFTKTGNISKKTDIETEALEALERADTLSKRIKNEGLEGLTGGELKEQLNVNDRLLSALENAKEFHYTSLVDDNILTAGKNPLDLPIADKESLIQQLKEYRESRSPITSEMLSGGRKL